jgi:hypothetical protein
MTMDDTAKENWGAGDPYELYVVAGAGKSLAGSSIALVYPENPLGQMLDAEQAH